MTEQTQYPLDGDAGRLTRHCKLELHNGIGRISNQDGWEPDEVFAKLVEHFGNTKPPLSTVEFESSFLIPAAGACLVFLRADKNAGLSRNFGNELTVTGESSHGRFRFECPRFYVKAVGSDRERSWAIATPINETATVTYGDERPTARVLATINNFDFEYGNWCPDCESLARPMLRIVAGGHAVTFAKRADYAELKTLLQIHALRTASLVEFTFDAWDTASEAEMAEFAYRVAGLCGIVTKQHAGIPVLTYQDCDGRPIKRLIRTPIESPFRSGCVLPRMPHPDGLPKLFEQCFDDFARIDDTDQWRALQGFCASIEDPPYLEQKYASLMAALEMLMRNSLVEGGVRSAQAADTMSFSNLLIATRDKLDWDIPSHYFNGDQARVIRNAVAHGNRLPRPNGQVREELDKWQLFLMRRVLMRLGFDGQIASPNGHMWSESQVSDFSEEHNSFAPSKAEQESEAPATAPRCEDSPDTPRGSLIDPLPALRFQIGFWHPFGPHGGETADEILTRKRREIEENGWTLWSFQRRRDATLTAWREMLLAANPEQVLVFCSDGRGCKEPQAATSACSEFRFVDSRDWNPMPRDVVVRQPLRANQDHASAFVVQKIIAAHEHDEPRAVEWFSLKNPNWRSNALPTRGEYLIRSGGGLLLRRHHAILVLKPPYLATVRMRRTGE